MDTLKDDTMKVIKFEKTKSSNLAKKTMKRKPVSRNVHTRQTLEMVNIDSIDSIKFVKTG